MLALQADSLPGPASPLGPIGFTGTALIGLGATLLTGLVRKLAGRADAALGSVDQKLTKAIGPALPIVATGLAALLPALSNAIGLTEVPDTAVIANAPASAITAIVLREAFTKIFGKR